MRRHTGLQLGFRVHFVLGRNEFAVGVAGSDFAIASLPGVKVSDHGGASLIGIELAAGALVVAIPAIFRAGSGLSRNQRAGADVDSREGRRVGRIAGHGRNLGRPAGEGVGVLLVAGLGGRFAIIARNRAVGDIFVRLQHSAVIVQPFDGVGVDSPLCFDRDVFCGHCFRKLGFPASEGVTGLGGGRRCSHGGVVILRDGSDFRAAIRVKGDGVLVDGVLCGDGQVRGDVGEVFVPAGEGVAGASRIIWRSGGAAMLDAFGFQLCSVVVNKLHHVGCGIPDGIDGHVLCGHGVGNFFAPAHEGVACPNGISGLGDGGAVVLRDGVNCRAAIGVEGDGVLVDGPLCGDGQILRRHGGGNLLVPASEGVACLGGGSRCGHGSAVGLRDGGNRGVASVLKSDGVLVDGPLCGDGQILRRHGGGDRHVPASEGVTGLGRSSGCGHGGAVVLRDGSNRGVASVLKSDGVLVDGVYRFDDRVSCDVLAVVIPLAGITLLGGDFGSLCGGAAVCDGLGIKGRSVFILPGYSVDLEFPLNGDGHIAGGHGELVVGNSDGGVIGIRDGERVKFVALSGSNGQRNSVALRGGLLIGNNRTIGTLGDGDGVLRHRGSAEFDGYVTTGDGGAGQLLSSNRVAVLVVGITGLENVSKLFTVAGNADAVFVGAAGKRCGRAAIEIEGSKIFST